VQQAGFIMGTEQERADDFCSAGVAKTAHHTIRGAGELHLLHAGPFTRPIDTIQPFGDDAVQISADCFEPPSGHADLGRGRGKSELVVVGEIFSGELLQFFATFAKGFLEKGFSLRINQQVKYNEDGGMLAGELLHTTFGGMNSLQQIVKSIGGKGRRMGKVIAASPT